MRSFLLLLLLHLLLLLLSLLLLLLLLLLLFLLLFGSRVTLILFLDLKSELEVKPIAKCHKMLNKQI